MSTSSINAATSGLTQMMMQMQQKAPEPPLKNTVDNMSEEDKATFDSKISSFSKEQMMYFMSLMSSNESDISAMSQDDATAAVFDLMSQASSIEDLSEVEGLSELDALANEMPPPPGGMPSSRQEAQDPLATLTQENMDTFTAMISAMSDEQKLEFGSLLIDSKDELATLGAEDAAAKVLSLLEEASTTVTNTSTQNAMMSNFTRGGSFVDIYS